MWVNQAKNPPPAGLLEALERALRQAWPRWGPICRRRPRGMVSYFRLRVKEGGGVLEPHTAQIPLSEVPDLPAVEGGSRAEFIASIELAHSAGLLAVLWEIEVWLDGRPASSWYGVACPDPRVHKG